MEVRSFFPGRSLRAALLLALGLGVSQAALAEPPQQIIVKFADKAEVSPVQADRRLDVIRQVDGARLQRLRRIGTGGDVFRIQGDRLGTARLEKLLAAIEALPGVEYAEEDRILHALYTPNDTRYSEQWDLYESAGGLNMPGAWDLTTGSGVRVGVIDTGYRPHADLAANIVGGYDFISDSTVANDGGGRDSDASDPGDWYSNGECGVGTGSSSSSWHGTHVSGTIAAVTGNGSGIAGIAYGAKVVPLRVLGKCGGYTSDIADAMIWGAGGSVSGVPSNSYPAQVLNMSLGGSGSCDNTTQAAINSARANGATVVVAAGNSNANAANYSPASCSGVVTVAAVGRTGGRAYYSNYGSVVEVAAPGGDMSSSDANGILSTLNTGTTTPGSDTYDFYQGTSMAAPHVAGVVALLYAVDSGITPDEVLSILQSTARSFPATCSSCGSGIVDAEAAVSAAQGGDGGGDDGGGSGSGTALSNGVPVTGLSGSTGTELQYTLAVPSGASNLAVAISGGSGDADLYVKFGSAPTTSSYDCRPYKSGNSESCSFASPSAGTYYVMVRGYSSFSGVTLTGSYTASSGGSSSCPSGYTQYTGSLSSGSSVYLPGTSGYSAAAGTHQGELTGPSSADFDLYLQKAGSVSWSNVSTSLSSSSSESISYSGSSGTYRWRVYAYSGSGSYTFCAAAP